MDDINKTLSDIISAAMTSLNQGNFEKALEEFRSAEVLDRDNPAILFNIGITYTRLGLFKTAIEYYQRVVSSGSGYIEIASVKKNLAYCLIKTGNYTGARSLLEELTAHSPDTAALNMKAYCLYQLNMMEEALNTYKEVLKKNNKDLNSLNSTAYLMSLSDSQLESAYKLALHVHNADRYNPAYLDTLGYICLKLKKYDEAAKHLATALSIMPFDKDIRNHYDELQQAVR